MFGLGVSLAYVAVLTRLTGKISFVAYGSGFGARYYLLGHCQVALLLKLACADHSRDLARPAFPHLACPLAI